MEREEEGFAFSVPPLCSTIQNITETSSHPTIKISSDSDESRAMSHDQLAEENQREGGEKGEGTEQSGSIATHRRETVAQLMKRVRLCVCVCVCVCVRVSE